VPANARHQSRPGATYRSDPLKRRRVQAVVMSRPVMRPCPPALWTFRL